MIQAAQSLRLVRQARLAFLWNWSQDCVERHQGAPRLTELLPQDEDKRDWSHLYEGDVLDD